MTRIYTKTGDDGTTGLIGGKCVAKDDPRIEAYGSVDELNAILGVVCSFPLPERTRRILARIQNDLFSIGAELALPSGMERDKWGIPSLTPLRQFILPGGSAAAAQLHLARTVARRVERRCVTLAHLEQIDQQIIRYLNRLSDLCFVLARYVNQKDSQAEIHPTFGKQT
jgi:cob(I)alamin adenosyltransferase